MRFNLIVVVVLFLAVHVAAQQEEEPKQCTGENDDGSCSSGYLDNDITSSSDGGDDDDDNSQEKQERQPDAKNPQPVSPPRAELSQCGLYMAESSIPHAGWGMYTGKKLLKGRVIQPLDVVIDAYDADVHHRFDNNNNEEGGRQNRKLRRRVPQWLMDQYHWSPEITKSQFSADMVNSIMVRAYQLSSWCKNTLGVLAVLRCVVVWIL